MKYYFLFFSLFALRSVSIMAQTEGGYQERLVYPIRIILLDAKNKPVSNAEVILFTPDGTVCFK